MHVLGGEPEPRGGKPLQGKPSADMHQMKFRTSVVALAMGSKHNPPCGIHVGTRIRQEEVQELSLIERRGVRRTPASEAATFLGAQRRSPVERDSVVLIPLTCALSLSV